MKKELYLGLDVHKDCIITAVAEEGRKGQVRETGAISNDLHAVEKWIARLRKAYGKETRLRACYEAVPGVPISIDASLSRVTDLPRQWWFRKEVKYRRSLLRYLVDIPADLWVNGCDDLNEG